ncbi:hypothetical protein DRN86_02230 [Candidatus Geothermarchaeota archaeon]|nr:MAG: hypothetical protein DRN86_02230 [Candidatus Geothermarchaeota archaeon]
MKITNTKISIFIPVYRYSETLEVLITSILRDPYKDKEIFVIIDEPTDESLKIVKKFQKCVNFILNGNRIGKVNALNETINLSHGEIFLFLDSDVVINSNDSLSRIIDALNDADIIEVKKNVIEDSFLAKMVKYDYLGFNSANWLFSKFIKKCLGVNGAAFAIRREAYKTIGGFRRVISEDLDLGIKSFYNGLKFKYLADIGVLVKIPSSWKWWIKQRKRWAIGAAQWLKENYKLLIKALRKHPQVLIPSLILIFPSLIPFLTTFFIPSTMIFSILSAFLMLFAIKSDIMLIILFSTSISAVIMKNLITLISTFALLSCTFYVFARKLGYRYNPLEFLIYYLIYSPIWLLIMLASIIIVLIGGDRIKIDWKV